MRLARIFPQTNSLVFRLIVGAAIGSVLLLAAGGFVLSNIFRGTVLHGFDDQLSVGMDGLIAAAETDAPDHVTLEGRLIDPRFERIFSGWYWQIVPLQAQDKAIPPQVSRSLWDQTVKLGTMERGAGNTLWGYATGPDRQRLRVLERRIELTGTSDRKSTRLNSSHVSESRMPSSA